MKPCKPRSRKRLIDQANENSLTHLLKDKNLTVEQKRELVAERNPFLYLLVGGNDASNKAIPQTRQA